MKDDNQQETGHASARATGGAVIIEKVTGSVTIHESYASPQVIARTTQLIENAYAVYRNTLPLNLINGYTTDEGIVSELRSLGEHALEFLASVLAYEDESGKIAAYALGDIGETSLPILTKALQSENKTVRHRAILAFGRIGEAALDTLRHMVDDGDVSVRVAVTFALGQVGEPALAELRQALKDDDAQVRVSVVAALGQIGEPALADLHEALNDNDVGVRAKAAAVLGQIGEPALADLRQALNDDHYSVRLNAVQALGRISNPPAADLIQMLDDEKAEVRQAATHSLLYVGELALDALIRALNDSDAEVRKSALIALSRFEDPVLKSRPRLLQHLTSILDDEDEELRWLSVQLLAKIGEPALDTLAYAIKDRNSKVKTEAINALARIGEPALEILALAIQEGDEPTQTIVVKALGNMGESTLPLIGQVLETASPNARFSIVELLIKIGRPAINLLVIALEDTEGQISDHIVMYLSGPRSGAWLDSFGRTPGVESEDVLQAILDELIVRRSGRSGQLFNARVIAEALQGVIERRPRLYNEVQVELCNLAYGDEPEIRERAVAIARRLGASDFATRVKIRADENPTVATAIMRMLGGGEAAAFFSELQSKALKNYRKPLVELEDMSRERWNELTQLARRSYNASLWLGTGLFIVGVIIIIVGLGLLIFSRDNWQQIGGSLISVLTAIAAMASQFWKEPVENIQEFFAKQARLQATFIGYMNRVAQLRLVFEDHYAKGEVTLEDLEAYQRGLSEAMTQAWEQLTDQDQRSRR